MNKIILFACVCLVLLPSTWGLYSLNAGGSLSTAITSDKYIEGFFFVNSTDPCDPNPNKPWIIDRNITCENKSVTVISVNITNIGSLKSFNFNLSTGNLTVQEGAEPGTNLYRQGVLVINLNTSIDGTYIFDNSTMLLNGTSNGSTGINISRYGDLRLVNNSAIARTNESVFNNFIAEVGSNITIWNSTVDGIGDVQSLLNVSQSTYWKLGFVINTSAANMSNVTFTNTTRVSWNGNSNNSLIRDLTIYDSEYSLPYFWNDQAGYFQIGDYNDLFNITARNLRSINPYEVSEHTFCTLGPGPAPGDPPTFSCDDKYDSNFSVGMEVRQCNYCNFENITIINKYYSQFYQPHVGGGEGFSNVTNLNMSQSALTLYYLTNWTFFNYRQTANNLSEPLYVDGPQNVKFYNASFPNATIGNSLTSGTFGVFPPPPTNISINFTYPITINVTDQHGNPINGANIHIYSTESTTNESVTQSFNVTTATNVDGLASYIEVPVWSVEGRGAPLQEGSYTQHPLAYNLYRQWSNYTVNVSKSGFPNRTVSFNWTADNTSHIIMYWAEFNVNTTYPLNTTVLSTNWTYLNWTVLDSNDTDHYCNVTFNGALFNTTDIPVANNTVENVTVQVGHLANDTTFYWSVYCCGNGTAGCDTGYGSFLVEASNWKEAVVFLLASFVPFAIILTRKKKPKDEEST